MRITKKPFAFAISGVALAAIVAATLVFVNHPVHAAAAYNSHPVSVHPITENLGKVSNANPDDPFFGCETTPISVGFRCYHPSQIRAAYDIQPLLNKGINGSGQTIVIIDAFQSPTITSDLKLFDGLFGLPDPTLNIIAPDGLTPFDGNSPDQTSWSGEISLDVEWSHVVAPNATIDLVLAKSDQDADLLSATQYAINHNLGDVISQSFGEAEACADPRLLKAEHAAFEKATAKGITLVASAGDFGAAGTCDGSSFFLAAGTPASDPLVLSVGGTQLNATYPDGTYQSETVWNEFATFGISNDVGGGGFSTIYSRPAYQAFTHGTRHGQRGVPDVSYDAAVNGGVLGVWSCPVAEGDGCDGATPFVFIFGGTSAGSPQWAGITALADQAAGRRLGFVNLGLYLLANSPLYHSDFHDITSGNNTFDGVTGFTAAPGWDAASGLGSPDVGHLLSILKGWVHNSDSKGM